MDISNGSDLCSHPLYNEAQAAGVVWGILKTFGRFGLAWLKNALCAKQVLWEL